MHDKDAGPKLYTHARHRLSGSQALHCKPCMAQLVWRSWRGKHSLCIEARDLHGRASAILLSVPEVRHSKRH